MNGTSIIIVVLFLAFSLTVNCQLEYPIDDCDKKCGFKLNGDFKDDCELGLFRNLSLCMVKNQCFSIDNYAKVLRDHYCNNDSGCFIICEVAKEKYIDCFREESKPQRSRDKRGACYLCISIDEININIGGGATKPAAMSITVAVMAYIVYILLL